jgi:hypothetical protein
MPAVVAVVGAVLRILGGPDGGPAWIFLLALLVIGCGPGSLHLGCPSSCRVPFVLLSHEQQQLLLYGV